MSTCTDVLHMTDESTDSLHDLKQLISEICAGMGDDVLAVMYKKIDVISMHVRKTSKIAVEMLEESSRTNLQKKNVVLHTKYATGFEMLHLREEINAVCGRASLSGEQEAVCSESFTQSVKMVRLIRELKAAFPGCFETFDIS